MLLTARFAIASNLFCRSKSFVVLSEVGDCGSAVLDGAPGDNGVAFSGSVAPPAPLNLYPGELTA